MKDLKFIHITKNAGTSIEDCANDRGIHFGRFHIEYESWHEPLHLKPIDLQLKYDWFAIVRNPYDRVVSEAYCNWFGYKAMYGKDFENVNKYNKFIQKQITNRPVFDHWREQYNYLPILDNVVCHILKYENINEEFNTLMKRYNLDLELNTVSNKSNRIYGINDFSIETILLINDVYSKDFEMFGYKKYLN